MINQLRITKPRRRIIKSAENNGNLCEVNIVHGRRSGGKGYSGFSGAEIACDDGDSDGNVVVWGSYVV